MLLHWKLLLTKQFLFEHFWGILEMKENVVAERLIWSNYSHELNIMNIFGI